MQKLLFTIIGLLVVSLSYGQKEINNTKGEDHQQVKGTKFFLIPPEGFADAHSFQGFQQAQSNSSILVMDIPGPFSEVSKGMNAEGLKTQGVILKEKSEVSVNGYQGYYLTSEQFAYGNYFTKYILVFGSEDNTYMVTGMHPKEFTELGEDIKSALFSIVYDSDFEIDPQSAANFQVDTENTKLKFAKLMAGMIMYTVDGKIPTESNDKTSYMVGQSLSNVETSDKKLYTINRLKRMPYKDLKLDEDKIKPVEIDGISGYEIEAEGIDEKSGRKELIYHVMLYTDNGYYLIVGTAKDDYSKNLKMFKRVTKTFRRK